MSNLEWTLPIVQDLHEHIPSADKLYGINKCYDMSTWEINMYEDVKKNKFDYRHDYDVFGTLATCQALRHKISVLNRRLQRTRTENKRLQKRNERLEELLLDYVARQIPD